MKGRRRTRRLTLTWLAALLGALAILAAGVGVVLIVGYGADTPERVVGEWLLQVSLVFVGTGVVSLVVRQVEANRALRDAWAASLHELVQAHDDAQMAARLLSAHATALTYAEQIKVLSSSRATLRRLASAPDIQEDEELHDHLIQMRRYLKYIVKEYQAKYLPVARQQRLDEAVLAHQIKKLAESSNLEFPLLPNELAQPLAAGLTLQDPGEFPRLNEFRTGFKESPFRAHYEVAKPIMQWRAGVLPSRPEARPDRRSIRASPQPGAVETANIRDEVRASDS